MKEAQGEPWMDITWNCLMSKEETSNVKVIEVKESDDDVSDSDTDSDSVESYEEQVPNSTKRSTARSDTFEVLPV